MFKNLTVIFIVSFLFLTLNLSGEIDLNKAFSASEFKTDEINLLKNKEEKDLLASRWGQNINITNQMRQMFVKRASFSGDEITNLKNKFEKSFEKVIAAGSGSFLSHLAWFIPDMFLDLFDMVTFGAGVGGGAGGEVHITRWAAIGLAAQGVIGVYWYYNRNLMIAPGFACLAIFGPWQIYTLGFYGAGTGWTEGNPGAGGKIYQKRGTFSIEDKIVQDGWSDPWGVGVGWAAEIHPIEIADFFSGFFTLGYVDISKDNYANPVRAKYKIGMPVID